MTVRRRVLIAFLLSLPVATAACAPDHEKRGQPVTADDIRILERADALLPDEARWNRHDTRDCPPRQAKLSLFCALHAATVEVLGNYDHRRVALQEVRFAIEEVAGGREFEHRLMDFNNLPQTRFADIKRVLAIARERVAARLRQSQSH
jgi:hypothetical protein